MTLQFQIDFEQKLPPEAQIGMEAADAHADPVWRRYIDGCILAVARRLEYFTVDEVLTELAKVSSEVATHNLAALGPRMKEVAKTLGYMEATENVKRSKLAGKKGNLHRVWRSKLFRGMSR
jgi:hypothetical protein